MSGKVLQITAVSQVFERTQLLNLRWLLVERALIHFDSLPLELERIKLLADGDSFSSLAKLEVILGHMGLEALIELSLVPLLV